MTTSRSTTSIGGAGSAATLMAAVACLAIIMSVRSEPEAHHSEWSVVTDELVLAWPLVIAARYDPANHFVLVDMRPGTSDSVARVLACETFLPLLQGVDATVGFALYEAPDRVLAHGDECERSS